jgi:hypothetical protein
MRVREEEVLRRFGVWEGVESPLASLSVVKLSGLAEVSPKP